MALRTVASGLAGVRVVTRRPGPVAKPSVVMIPGLYATAREFRDTAIQQRLAAHTATVIYEPVDWEDFAKSGQMAGMCKRTRQLRDALALTGVPPPYVFCAHSLGTLHALAFADAFPALTHGVLAVEGVGSPLLAARALRRFASSHAQIAGVLDELEQMGDFRAVAARVPVSSLQNVCPRAAEVAHYFGKYGIQLNPVTTAGLHLFLAVRAAYFADLARAHPLATSTRYAGLTHDLHRDVPDATVAATLALVNAAL